MSINVEPPIVNSPWFSSGTRLSQFVVQLQDPAMSRIAPGAAPVTQEAEKTRGVLPRGTIEIWPWLVGAALILLAAEWAVYLRGR